MAGFSRRGDTTQLRVLSLEALGGLLLAGGAAYLLQRRTSTSRPAADSASPDASNGTAGKSDAAAASEAPGASEAAGETEAAGADEATAHSGTPSESTEAGSEESAAEGGFRVHTERLTVDEAIGTGPLDGAWWPTSQQASEAVVGLVEDLGDAFGRVTRIALPMKDWSDERPKTVQVDGRAVHLAWFAGMRRQTARVTFESDEAITVVVLPVDSDKDAAASALSAAAEDRSSADLLQEAGAETAGASAGDSADTKDA